MRIQHNIMAMNAYRNYTNNTSALSSNLEKLSSGYKINRAGDDAAGLAISEKMRAQITGLDVAQKNAKDGISLVQTAEGALTEVHDMLNRMVELASQSANGTYDNETDRANLQKEMDQLLAEIDRIADSSNFNGINLLDGTMQSGADISTKVDFTVDGTLPGVGTVLGSDTVLHNTALTAGGTEFSIDLHNYTFDNATGNTLEIQLGDNTTISIDGDDSGSMTAEDIVAKIVGGTGVEVNGQTMTAGKITINGQDFTVTDAGNGRLTFKQDKAPATADEEINGAMNVTISGAVVTTAAAGSSNYGAITPGATINDTYDVTFDFTKADGTAGTQVSTTVTFEATDDAASAAQKLADALNAESSFSNLFTASVDDTGNLIVTNNTTGETQLKAGNIGLTAQNTGTAAVTTPAGAATPGTSAGQDYNVSTTNITNVTAGGVDRLASTYFDLTKDMVTEGSTITIGNTTYTFTADADALAGGGNVIDISSGDLNTIGKNLTAVAGANTTYTVGYDNGRVTVTEVKGQTDFDLTTIEGIEKSLSFTGAKVTGSGLTLQIGDTSDSWNQLTVDIQDMHVDSLGIEGLDISEQGSAQAAIDKIKAAINTVSSVRGTLGATQNRLDHTINNLSVMEENIQDAESTIRDTDVAEEMMAYTKNNILVQSAQAMLAQANQVPQGVLQLLQ